MNRKRTKKILTFQSGNLNPIFSVIFPPIIWIFMEGEEPEIKSKQASKRDRTLPDALCKWGPGHADLKIWRPHQLQRWRKRLDHFLPNLGHLCRDLTTEGRITDLETKNSWKYSIEKSLGGIKCISSTTNPTMMIMMWYFDIAIFVMCPRTNQMIAACSS